MRRKAVVACVVVLGCVGIGAGVGYHVRHEAEVREATTARTSDGSYPLMLKVYVEKAAARVDSEDSIVHAELHNVSDKYQTICAAGFEARVAFEQEPKPDPKDGIRCDWLVSPFAKKLMGALQGQSDFVTLAPGRYYGVTFREKVPATGVLTWSVSYSNSRQGDRQDSPAWVGTIGPVKSGRVRVMAAKGRGLGA
jgi:hypothetical protein